MSWQTARVNTANVVPAPDGSAIRPLITITGASMVHCTLPPGHATRATRHRTVEEVWYCVSGRGEVWRQSAERSEIVELEPGAAVSIPLGTTFQFRTRGTQPLELIITTAPPWPGDTEAVLVDGTWEARL